MVIEQTSNRYHELKYLIKGFNYYHKFISNNLKLNLPDLTKYYYNIQKLYNKKNGKRRLTEFVEKFKKEENNELSLFYEVIRYFEEKKIKYYVTKTTLRVQIKDWITLSTAIIPLLILVLQGYLDLQK